MALETYLGSGRGFPNLFAITVPHSAIAFSNVPVSVEQHVELVSPNVLP